MYITTFYSFKGGVGRSMALVNAAVELANRGRRVLVVDFDLEAPGLDTFDVLRTRISVPGIIDFVKQYQCSRHAPDVRDFVRKTEDIGEDGGELWMMPSGMHSDSYAQEFNQIDWGELYDEQDGYLLFEDLRQQWRNVVNPDYVLIDSRTGHTDTGGICTRQLPDAVVILFFPNDQNLRGLTKVVGDIRAEKATPRAKVIDLHFVMSNVPDLDDEDNILRSKIDDFRRRLELKRDPMIVHRYDSLSLLNQAVFIKTRPRSRLATEYRDLVERIVRGNLEDRDGALDYIDRVRFHWRRRKEEESPGEIERTLKDIGTRHSGDGEILFHLGVLREGERKLEIAGSLFDRAIKAGYEKPEAYLRRARFRRTLDDREGAQNDALTVLQSQSVRPPHVREAMDLIGFDTLDNVSQLTAVASLDFEDSVWLADGLNSSKDERQVAATILRGALDMADLTREQWLEGTSELAMAYLGLGECKGAMEVLDVEDNDVRQSQRDLFNYGMAAWGENGEVRPELFRRVIELEEPDRSGNPESNYLQCMAVAYWAVDEIGRAFESIDGSRGALQTATVSCWRYLQVSVDEFHADLDEIRELIQGDASRKPRFARSIESGSGGGFMT